MYAASMLLVIFLLILISAQDAKAAWAKPPVLLKVSDAVKPGKLISISGEGIKQEKVRVALSLDSDGGSPAAPPAGSRDLEIVSTDVKGHYVVVALPDDVPGGIYNIWVRNDVGWSAPIKLNAPRAMFMSEKEAWTGQSIQVVGRNFDGAEFASAQNVRVRLRRLSDGTVYDMTEAITDSNPYCVTFTVGNQPLAEYGVDVSNDGGVHWASPTSGQTLTLVAAGADPLGMGVAWARSFKWDSVFNACDHGAVPDSGANETANIQRAINAAAKAGGGVVYLPNGKYRITSLRLRPHVVLQGEDPERTNLVYAGKSPAYTMIVGSDSGTINTTKVGHMGVANLKMTLADADHRPACFIQFGHAFEPHYDQYRYNCTAEQMFAINVHIDYPYTTRGAHKLDADGHATLITGAAVGMVCNAKERVLLKGNRWVGFSAVPSYMVIGEYYTEKNNCYEYSNYMSGNTSMYAFREGNTLIGHREVDGCVSAGFPDAQLGGMYCKGRQYLFDNTVRNIGTPSGNDGEAFTADSVEGYWNDGDVVASTPTSITCTVHNPEYPPAMPSIIKFSDPHVLIVDGTGLGQMRKITDIDGNTINVATAWDVQPDTTSKWCIFLPIQDVTIYKNRAIDTVTSYQFYGCTMDWVVADNLSKNGLGAFVFARRWQDTGINTTGLIPDYYHRIVRNTMVGADFKNGDSGIWLSGERGNLAGAYNEVQVFNTEIRENMISGDLDAPGRVPSGVLIYSGSHGNDGLGVTGDITNTIIEGNTFWKLPKGIELIKNNYGLVLTGNIYEATVEEDFVTDGISQNIVVHGLELHDVSNVPKNEAVGEL